MHSFKRPFKRHCALLAAPLVALLLLSGCGSVTLSDGPSQANFITLKDTSPHQLDARVNVDIGGYDTASRNITTIDISFTVGNRTVNMVGGEQVVCNGSVLRRYTGSFEVQASTATFAAKPVTCTYTSGKSSATITFTTPSTPAILSPRDGSSVPRDAHTTVSYRVPAGPFPSVVATWEKGKAIASAVGATQATLDTSAFAAGAGQIALTLNPTVADGSASGFRSLAVRATAMTMVAVTWT